MENKLREDLERQLEESFARMKEYEKNKFHEQQVREHSNYVHILEKIKELDEKEKNRQILEEKIEVLQKKLKESADRMAQYRKEGFYDQQMIEHTNYNYILTQIAELKKQIKGNVFNINEKKQKTKIESIESNVQNSNDVEDFKESPELQKQIDELQEEYANDVEDFKGSPEPQEQEDKLQEEYANDVEDFKGSPEPQKQEDKSQEEYANDVEDFKENLVPQKQIDELQEEHSNPINIQKVKEQQKPENSSNSLRTIKNLQILIGRKAKVSINSMEYILKKEVVKQGCELTDKQVFSILQDIGLDYSYKEIKSLYNKFMLDPVVINILYEIEKQGCDVKDTVNQYIQDIMAANEGKAFQNNCHIVYDEKDINKASITEAIKRRVNNLFRDELFKENEIDTYNKKAMLYHARNANRLNLVKIDGKKHSKLPAIGEYKPNFLGKICELIAGERGWGDEDYFLPRKEDIKKVAFLYNRLQKEKKASRINSERWLHRYGLTEEQKTELKQLYRSQISQTSEKKSDKEKNKSQEWKKAYASTIEGIDRKKDKEENQIKEHNININNSENTINEEDLQRISDELEKKFNESTR